MCGKKGIMGFGWLDKRHCVASLAKRYKLGDYLIELLIKHKPDNANRFVGIWPLGSQDQLRAVGCSEGKQAEDAAAIRYLTSAFKLYLALKASCSTH